MGALSHREQEFKETLCVAVAALWGKLPEAIQASLFEQAVVAGHRGERDESLRQELARFLHEHHPRTPVNNRRG
jgi:hypothetical protein